MSSQFPADHLDPVRIVPIESLCSVRQELQAELAFTMSYSGHAAPLMPLRARDLQALIELFHQDEIEAIEADILENLLRRSPEPHWEAPSSDFLNSL